MRKIEYEIKLNDDGKPYIHLEDTHMGIEERLFCFEIVRYTLFGMAVADDEETELPEALLRELKIAGEVVGGISNRFGDMILERDNAIDDIINDYNKGREDDIEEETTE